MTNRLLKLIISSKAALFYLHLVLPAFLPNYAQGVYPGAVDPTFFAGWARSYDDEPLAFIGTFSNDSILISQNRNLRKISPEGSADYTFKKPSGLYGVGAVDPSGLIALTYAAPTTGVIIETHLRWLEPDGTIARELLLPERSYYHSAVAFQLDGKVLLWNEQRLYRLTNDGTIDPSFNCTTSPSGGYGGRAKILVQSDGRIVVIGPFLEWGNLPRKGIARFNSDGSLDGSYAPGVYLVGPNYQGPLDAALDANDRLVIVGRFSTAFGKINPYIVVIRSDGSLDPGFNFEGGVAVQDTSRMALAVLPEGEIIFSGDSGYLENPMFLIRMLPDGKLKKTHRVNAGNLLVQHDGDVVTAGSRGQFYLMKPDGSLDSSFYRKGVQPQKIIRNPNGDLLLSAIYPDPNGSDRFYYYGLSRLLENGSFEAIRVTSPDNAPGIAFCFQGDKIIAAKWGQVYRMTQDAQPDPSFSDFFIPSGSNIRTIELAPDGKLLLGLSSTDWNANCLFRLNSNGIPDQTFNGVIRKEVQSVRSFPNGQILVAGGASVNGKLVAILNNDGSIDNSFVSSHFVSSRYDVGIGDLVDIPGRVNDAYPLPSGEILVVGDFYRYGDHRKRGAVRLDRTGQFLPGFELIENDYGVIGHSVACDDSGRILIVTSISIQRFSQNGSSDSTWASPRIKTGDPYGPLTSAVTDREGHVVIFGFFAVNDMACYNLARLFSSVSAPILTSGSLGTITIQGTPGGACVIEASSDFRTWRSHATNYAFPGTLEFPYRLADPAAFFRAKLR